MEFHLCHPSRCRSSEERQPIDEARESDGRGESESGLGWWSQDKCCGGQWFWGVSCSTERRRRQAGKSRVDYQQWRYVQGTKGPMALELETRVSVKRVSFLLRAIEGVSVNTDG